MKRKQFYKKGDIVYCVKKDVLSANLTYYVAECTVLSDSYSDSKCIHVTDIDFSDLEFDVGTDLVFINEKDAYLQAIKMNEFLLDTISSVNDKLREIMDGLSDSNVEITYENETEDN